ncbi:MAG TPA: osmotically inducible protein OsmC [Thioploca sp.]|nr:osmotically inducible protein OsmC [Thioploca sp.]
MDAVITFDEGMQVTAQFKNFIVNTDQAKTAGGKEKFPDPFSYFLSSLGTCAGYFVLRFCQSRNISTEGIKLYQSNDWNAGRVENIHIEIELPPSFPKKYATALIRATNECTVKKTLINPPKIEVTIR